MKKIFKQVLVLVLIINLQLTPGVSLSAFALEADSSPAMNTRESNGEVEKSEGKSDNIISSVSGSDAGFIDKEIPSISGSDTIIVENEIQEGLSVSGSDASEMIGLTYLAASSYANQFDLDTYNESIYRAERYLATDSVSYKNISSMMEIGIPSDIIVNLGKDDWGFMSSVAAWKAANMVVSPSQIAEGALDEIGYYEAIIFSIFIEQSKDTNYLYRLINEANSETNKIVSQIEKWIKETDALDQKVDVSTGMLKSLSEKDKEKLEKELEIMFIEEHPLLDGVSEIGGMIKTVFDFSDTLTDAIETMAAYMQLYELPQEMKMVISYMYEKCPDNNTYLKQALQEASDAAGSLASAFSVSALHTVDELTVDVAGELIDDWWKSILAKNKYTLAYSSGAKLGIFISNTLFSTDKTIEQFEKMACLQEVYKLLKDVIISSGETFEHARTVENADVYIAAVDALYKIGELSCDFAMNFEEVYYTETIAALKLLWENDSYENYMQKLRNIKSYYISNKKILTRSYLDDLEADYPEIYVQLYGSNEEKYVAVEGIKFPQDEITIGTQDVYTCFEIPAISPSNATKQGVIYASSDTSILEVSGPVVMLTPHKPGTVTVTVTTEDGGYTDTILVHVVEGKVADFQYWGVPATKSNFAGGDGTAENPYQIATAEQLDAVRNDMCAYYIQTADIDLAGWNWEPIGCYFFDRNTNMYTGSKFMGSYDGQGYKIENLTIARDGNYNMTTGLFGISGGKLVNISLENCFINIDLGSTLSDNIFYGRADSIGGIVGINEGHIITNCSVSGNINITNAYAVSIGGISASSECRDSVNNAKINVVGIKYGDKSGSVCCGGVVGTPNYANGTVMNCTNHGDVFASADTFLDCGGIVGSGGEISGCTNHGDIKGEIIACKGYHSNRYFGYANCNVGGIVGATDDFASKCINYGNISSSKNFLDSDSVNCSAGGICGSWGTFEGSVSNSFNFGKSVTSATDFWAGRIIGAGANITNCYSVGSTLVNGAIPTENIGTDLINGATIIENDSIDQDAQAFFQFGADSTSFGKEINGDSGNILETLLVLKSNKYTIDDLTILFSNSNVAEIDHIEKDAGAYIPALDGSEHIATVYIKLKDIGTSDIMIFAPDGTSKTVSVTSNEAIYDIKMYSYIPTMMLGEGRSIGAAVQLYKNGIVVKDGANFIITSSNSNIVSVSNIRNELDGTFFDINGIDVGEAIITVTENLSGAVYSTTVQVNSGILTYNAEAMPEYYDGKNKCNGYIDGMYIDEFTIKSDSNGSMGGRAGISVSFNVYNTTSACGVVDVYDADGKLIKSELVKRFSDSYITSIKDTLISAYKLVEDYAEGDILTYKQESYSQCTPIEVEVPWGGHIEITNNPVYSETCAIYNYADFYTTSILLLDKSIKLKGSEIKKVSEVTANNVVQRFVKSYTDSFSGTVSTKKISKIGEKFVEKIGAKASKKWLESGIQRELASLIDDGLEIFKECDVNIEEIILNSAADVGIGIVEDALIDAMGAPGATLSAMFTIDEYLNYGAFLLDIFAPHSNNAMIIHFDNENGCLCDNGVSVKAENGTTKLSQDNYVLRSVILSNEMDLSGQAKESLDKISAQYIVRNIYLLKDDVVTQPNQTVQVTLPIPKDYDLYKCKLYWVQDDGNLTEVSTQIVNRNFVFFTNHFSNYAIVESLEEKPSIAVENVLLNRECIILKEGDCITLETIIIPNNATNQEIEWSSNNSDIAIVDNGIVKAIKEGTTEIIVTTQDGKKTASCKVTVTGKPIKPFSVKFNVVGTIGGRNVTFDTDMQDAVIYYSSKTSNLTTKDACVKPGETVLFENFYGTIYARAYANGQWSNVSRLILKIPVVNAPFISTDNKGNVTIRTSTPGSTIYYTTDGSVPTPSNGIRIGGSTATLPSFSGTLRAIAVRSCFTNSAVTSKNMINSDKNRNVTFSVKGVFGGRDVTFDCAMPGAKIYYSSTTSKITTGDKCVNAGETVRFEDFYGTIYARSYCNGEWGNVCRLILKIPVAGTPAITIDSQGYATIQTATPGCYLYYTTDGSTPTMTNGRRVTASRTRVYVGRGVTVKAIAVRSCFTNSKVAEKK